MFTFVHDSCVSIFLRFPANPDREFFLQEIRIPGIRTARRNVRTRRRLDDGLSSHRNRNDMSWTFQPIPTLQRHVRFPRNVEIHGILTKWVPKIIYRSTTLWFIPPDGFSFISFSRSAMRRLVRTPRRLHHSLKNMN